jgi:hypothetical protein
MSAEEHKAPVRRFYDEFTPPGTLAVAGKLIIPSRSDLSTSGSLGNLERRRA